MTKNIDTINAAVALLVKAAILAARFSGRVCKRSLKRLSKMDADTKDKEVIFLRGKVNQQQMQIPDCGSCVALVLDLSNCLINTGRICPYFTS